MISPNFDGATYEPQRDHERLTTQYDRVFYVMSDGRWRTPRQIEGATGYPWASISARLRDMRKPRFGAHTVKRRYVGEGLYEYRLIVAPRQLYLL
jgi:hypothetical protein